MSVSPATQQHHHPHPHHHLHHNVSVALYRCASRAEHSLVVANSPNLAMCVPAKPGKSDAAEIHGLTPGQHTLLAAIRWERGDDTGLREAPCRLPKCLVVWSQPLALLIACIAHT